MCASRRLLFVNRKEIGLFDPVRSIPLVSLDLFYSHQWKLRCKFDKSILRSCLYFYQFNCSNLSNVWKRLSLVSNSALLVELPQLKTKLLRTPSMFIPFSFLVSIVSFSNIRILLSRTSIQSLLSQNPYLIM